jgi:hypothetical protein
MKLKVYDFFKDKLKNSHLIQIIYIIIFININIFII